MSEASNKVSSAQQYRSFTPFRKHLETGPVNASLRNNISNSVKTTASEPEGALQLKQRLDRSEVLF